MITAPRIPDIITIIDTTPAGHVRTFDAFAKSADSVLLSQRALTQKSSSTIAPLERNTVY